MSGTRWTKEEDDELQRFVRVVPKHKNDELENDLDKIPHFRL